ncbi:V-set and immunoglobulin domain-containing protein 1-like isoform X9 [Anguilla anguilla]|nr:V-set and immunoglobulin domain-containing protein 1-like isoform X9 [Anguilla anguilla]
MGIAGFGVLIGLLLASPASPSRVVLSVSVGHSRTLPCNGTRSRDVEWRFQQESHPDWLLVAELHDGSFSPGSGFQGRVESFHLTEPGNYSLILSNVVYSDLGIYECRYKDETVLSDVKLNIFVPSSVPVALGMSASLPCFGNIKKHTSAGDLDILWKRDEKIVYQLLKNSTTYGPGFENRASVSPEQALHGNLSLTIRQTRFSDQGDYQCFCNSPKERGNPDSASLTVTGLPRSVPDSAGDSAGLPAGAVAGIVLLVLALLAVVCFVVWKYRAKFSRPPVSVPETQPSHPEPSLPLSEIQTSPAEPRLSEPETKPSDPELRLSEPETQPQMPETHPLMPETHPQMPETHPQMPETQPLMPETQPLMPEAQPLMPETQPLMPETQPLMPETQPQMPETQPLMPETQPFDQNEKLEKGDGIL